MTVVDFLSKVTADITASGANGLDTGAEASNTWYYGYVIYNPTTGTKAALLSTSSSAPTMPSGYTKKRRIGSVITDASGHIRAVTQRGDRFQLGTPVYDINVASMTTVRELRALTVPGGIVVEALVRAYSPVAGGQVIVLTDPAEADITPSLSAAPMHTLNAAGQAFQGAIGTDTSRQIATRSNTAGTILRGATFGWVDRRGRDA
jgi:hypothetical protein